VGDFVRLILDSIQFVWPFRRVQKWERALYMVCGRWVCEIGPGVYPILWFFCEVHAISVADALCGTPRLDITLSDGTIASFQAICTARVIDVRKAVLSIDDYATTTQELLGAVLSDRLAQVDRDRLSPEKRGRLISDLRRWVADEAAGYGVEIDKVRFSSFVLNVKAHRLLVDQSQPAAW
jgi:regulator of protease activity HflC (stomatin/prohibitin superfamily)